MNAAALSWSYDGSVEGLLELTLRAYEEGSAPAFVNAAGRGDGWLFGTLGPCDGAEPPGGQGIGSRDERTVGLLRKRSPRLLGAALRAWMSEESVEPDLLAVAAAVGLRGEAVLGDSGMPALRALRASAHRVNREIHRLIGLARFSRRPDGLYVALLEPDHDVLPAIAPAFLPRFGLPADPPCLDGSGTGSPSLRPETFALVDLRRRYALLRQDFSSPCRFSIRSGEAMLALLPDDGDREEEGLWRRYFHAAENPSRRNAALQRRLMPERYWKHLAEMTEQGQPTRPSTLPTGADPAVPEPRTTVAVPYLQTPDRFD